MSGWRLSQFGGIATVTKCTLDGSSFFDPSRRRSLGWQPLRKRWSRALRSQLWRRLPPAIRRATLRFVLTGNRAPVALDAPAAEPICIVGLLSTPTGVGEGGRLAGRALTALGYEVLGVDVSDIIYGTSPPLSVPPLLETGGGTVILHFNPDNLAAILTALGRERLRGKRIIGYWAWELTRIPHRWIGALEEVDEVWTPSRFVADAVRAATSKPVRVVPHPVAQGRRGIGRREHFGIGEEFVALAMFNFASYSRKNPVAAIRAFQRAFGDDDNRLLILKCLGDAQPDEMRELRAAIGAAPNIRIDERRLSDGDRLDLIASADVVLSLHRAEGFGLVMPEAMLARVAVIATAWSGHLDFIDESSALLVPFRMVEASDSRGVYGFGEWADPDVGIAAEHLRAIAADLARFEPMRQAAHERAQRILGLEGFGRAVKAAIPLCPRQASGR